MMDAERVGGVGYTMNQSVTGALWRALGPGGPILAWLLIAAGLLGLAWVTIREFARAGYPAHGVVTCAVFGLLASPISWSHHWVWVVPILLVLSDAALGGRRDATAAGLAVAWLAATASSALWRLPTGEGVDDAVPMAVKALSDVYVLLGMLTLFWLWRASRRYSTVDLRGAEPRDRQPDQPPGRHSDSSSPLRVSRRCFACKHARANGHRQWCRMPVAERGSVQRRQAARISTTTRAGRSSAGLSSTSPSA